jgi:hypothetical protein
MVARLHVRSLELLGSKIVKIRQVAQGGGADMKAATNTQSLAAIFGSKEMGVLLRPSV